MRKGDETAWSEFVRAYTPPAIAFLRSLGLSREDAEDLWQEVLLKLEQRGLETYRPDMGKFRSWLMGVMCHKMKDMEEKAKAAKRDVRMTVSGDEPLSPNDADGATRWEQLEDETQQHFARSRQAVQEQLEFALRYYPDESEKRVYLDWFWNGAPKRKRSAQAKNPRPRLGKPAHDTDKQIAARHGLKTHQLTHLIDKVQAHLQKRWATEPGLRT
jgi:RNA polymerase sigma factor (sigma-70 family)